MSLVVRTLPDRIVELVRDRILDGTVPAGASLRQDALASELGVSKIPLREALARLEEEGLIASQANRGFFVRPLSATEAEEVYALRLTLEPEAVAASADVATPADHATARKALDTIETSDGTRIGALNRAFHMALIRPANRPVTAGILERLHILSDRYVRVHLEPLGRDERASAEHRALLAAFLARDSDGVARLTRSHIQLVRDDLRQQLAAGEQI